MESVEADLADATLPTAAYADHQPIETAVYVGSKRICNRSSNGFNLLKPSAKFHALLPRFPGTQLKRRHFLKEFPPSVMDVWLRLRS